MKPSALALVAIALLLPACSDTGELRPPELALGQDTCAVCGMAVSDDRYAAAVVVRDAGRDATLLLDDIGELPELELPRHDAAAVFVRDEATRAWVPGESAHYLRAESLRTPMGYGIAALADAHAAEARRQELGGEVVEFSSLDPRRAPSGDRP
jgi:copper chaperone NosL